MQDDTILHMLILFSCETLHFPQSQGVMEINLWVSVSPGILDDKVKYWSCRSKAQLTCALELGQLQELWSWGLSISMGGSFNMVLPAFFFLFLFFFFLSFFLWTSLGVLTRFCPYIMVVTEHAFLSHWLMRSSCTIARSYITPSTTPWEYNRYMCRQNKWMSERVITWNSSTYSIK